MLVSTFQGSKPGKKHKLNYRQKCEIQDLVDLGDGYDETDPFVDNTEAVCIVMFITHSLPLKSSPFDRMALHRPNIIACIIITGYYYRVWNELPLTPCITRHTWTVSEHT